MRLRKRLHFGFLFQSNLRWRRLDDVAESLRYWLRNISLPNLMKEQLHYGIGEVFREIQRWGMKIVVGHKLMIVWEKNFICYLNNSFKRI